MKRLYAHFLLCSFILLFGTCVRAQNNGPASKTPAPTGSVSGRVMGDGEAAAFTNVLLLKAADSSVVKLELADETGHFTFAGIVAADYFVRTSGIGIGEQNHPGFSLAAGQDLTLPDYLLQSSGTTLDAVEVVARKPFLEQKAGMLVVNVDQSITGQGGTLIDLLRKVPGVVVVGDRVSMAGKSGLTFLIDGRPTKYMDLQSLLRDMPADNIKSIEVISQPGAAFDAEGSGGVINIVLKKNSLLGTNGQVYIGGGYGELAKYRSGVDLSHRQGKVNLTGGASYNHRSWVEGLDLVRRFSDRTFLQSNTSTGTPTSYSVRGGMDYDFNDRNRAGINARYGWGSSPRNGDNRTEVVTPETHQLMESFVTNPREEKEWYSLNTDAFYRIKLDTSGQELNFDASYNRFERDTRIELKTVGADFPDRINLEPSMANIISGQVDYKKPFGEHYAFSAGVKMSRAELDNELLARVAENGGFVVDANLSNRFLYDEDIKAAYTSLRWEKGELGANIGLRYEDTRMEGYNVTVDSFNRRNFAQLFPSLSFSAPAFGPVGVSLAYSYRIERPSYYDLNPFISYLDPLTFEKGNPFLRPELIHSAQFSLTYEKQPFFNLSYDFTSDVIADVTEQDAVTGIAFQNTVNLDRFVRYGGSLFFPLDFIAKPISGYGGFQLYYNDYTSNFLGGNLDQDQWSLTAFFQVNAKLPMGWKGEVSGWYQGKGIDGIIRTNPLYGVSAGLEKDFLDDRLNLVLSGDGIIQKFFTGTIRYQEQNLDVLSTWEAPVFSAKLTYKFGNRFLKRNEGRNSSASEERGRITE
ncbi:TonB-dependent receptor [Neolewinella lacunae]|uniref:TonB-dependent receptor n=1 Tax=Neolewinella lacunae TaxID=1517758 RepID=A0A923PM80_9BACT|nr:TonB-dependent receptor [Neolewinella lacunae]MBC6993859.1 TonB-dependent receptor [Neolewinella lacunae]MDN3637080.1 TonB-dependent receptor [Neolewinella lacunae]